MDGKATTGRVFNYSLCKSRIVCNVNYKRIRDNRGVKRLYIIWEKNILSENIVIFYPNCYKMYIEVLA